MAALNEDTEDADVDDFDSLAKTMNEDLLGDGMIKKKVLSCGLQNEGKPPHRATVTIHYRYVELPLLPHKGGRCCRLQSSCSNLKGIGRRCV